MYAMHPGRARKLIIFANGPGRELGKYTDLTSRRLGFSIVVALLLSCFWVEDAAVWCSKHKSETILLTDHCG